MRAVTTADHFHSTRLAGAGFPKSEAGIEDKLEPPYQTRDQKTALQLLLIVAALPVLQTVTDLLPYQITAKE
jgi:hypothetical protein